MIDSNNVKEALCERIRNRAYSFDYGENISNMSRFRKIQRHLIDIIIMIECMILEGDVEKDNTERP